MTVLQLIKYLTTKDPNMQVDVAIEDKVFPAVGLVVAGDRLEIYSDEYV